VLQWHRGVRDACPAGALGVHSGGQGVRLDLREVGLGYLPERVADAVSGQLSTGVDAPCQAAGQEVVAGPGARDQDPLALSHGAVDAAAADGREPANALAGPDDKAPVDNLGVVVEGEVRREVRLRERGPCARQDVCPCRDFRDGASRDRTGDLLLAKQALSHLSYGPVGPRV
jgi:hypothetical protein